MLLDLLHCPFKAAGNHAHVFTFAIFRFHVACKPRFAAAIIQCDKQLQRGSLIETSFTLVLRAPWSDELLLMNRGVVVPVLQIDNCDALVTLIASELSIP